MLDMYGAAGSFGQSQLDRPAQILDDVTEPTLNRKDHDPTYGVCSHPYRQACSLEACLGGWCLSAA
jgi:hypothetical protein